MIVYLVATLIACALAWQGTRSGRRWPWFVAAAIPLTLVSALRWDVGTDFYYTYYPRFLAMECRNLGGTEELVNGIIGPLFARLQKGPPATVLSCYRAYCQAFDSQEPGLSLLMEFASRCGLGFRGVVVITALLVGLGVFLAVYRQSRSPVLAIYLYVATSNYFLGLNIIRQYLAIVLLLVAVEFIVRRQLLHFLTCIAVATLFHRSAIVLYPCYLLAFLAIRPWQGVVLVSVALLFSAIAEPMALWTLPKIGLERYCLYFGQNSHFVHDGFERVFFAINLTFMALGACYWRQAKERSPYFTIWYGMTVIGTVALAFSGSLPLMKRINFYFAAPQFLLLPEILLAESRVGLRRILTVLVVIGFALETFVAVCVYNKNEVLPYGISCRPDHARKRVRAARPFGWCKSKRIWYNTMK